MVKEERNSSMFVSRRSAFRTQQLCIHAVKRNTHMKWHQQQKKLCLLSVLSCIYFASLPFSYTQDKLKHTNTDKPFKHMLSSVLLAIIIFVCLLFAFENTTFAQILMKGRKMNRICSASSSLNLYKMIAFNIFGMDMIVFFIHIV